jgi:hypothetical protein
LKIAKYIFILGGIGVGAYLLKIYLEKRKITEQERLQNEKLKALFKYNEEMRKLYKDISNSDDFIKGLKYLDNPSPFGYDVSNLESKKVILQTYSLDYLQNILDYLYNGIQKNTDEQNLEVINFLNKLY